MSDIATSTWTVAIVAFATVAFGVLALAMLWEWWGDRRKQKEIVSRLDSIARGERVPGGDPFGDLFREAQAKEMTWLEPLVRGLPRMSDMHHLLEQADLSWRVGTFLLITLGAAVATGLMVLVVSGLWFVALAASLLGASLPYVYVRRRKTKRLLAFEEGFPEAIDLLGRAIRAGHAFSTGLQMVADESPSPISDEYRRVFEEQKFGLALEDSLLALADRIELLDMRIFVTAVLIQREVGGNLAEILDKIAYTIRERFMIQRQVRVYTAQGRFTGYLLAGLPVAVGFLIFLLNNEYMMVLFRETIGRVMIAVALILQITGFLIIRKIINIKI